MTYLDVLRAQLQAIIAERTAAKAELDAVLATPAAEGRSDLTEAEQAAFAEARAKVADAKTRQEATEARIAELSAIESAEEARAAVVPTEARPQTIRVRSEERTYSRASEAAGTSFLADLVARSSGDLGAMQRLERHMTEERTLRPGLEQRAAASTAFAGLVIPQYLTDLVAPTARAGRPLADLCRKHPLPAQGMTVNISRITTGTSTAVQTENNAASETNIDDTLLSPAVITIAGQQTVSRQAVERGTGVEQVVLGDLMSALNTKLDATLITASTTGLNAVTDANVDVAYTDGSPTVAEMWPKLADCVQQVQTGAYGGVTHWLMHPRRFWWLASVVGTSFPFVSITGAGPQAGGQVDSSNYGGIAGTLMGIPVVLDANIATDLGGGTEDAIYAINTAECHLWEDDVAYIRAEQTAAASLGVLFVVYKYLAYTFSRYPSANGRIAGTGLAAPSF